MKKIGLVGGIGPASTIAYYKGLISRCLNNKNINHYPEIIIDSVNMNNHDKAIAEHDYNTLSNYIIKSLNNLKHAGAEIAAITANTEHIVWDRICNDLPLQTISPIDSVQNEIKNKNYSRILILGTKWTMANGLFEKPIKSIGKDPITPTIKDQNTIGNLIYPNLENGIIVPNDKKQMIEIIHKYYLKYNIDSILLGCTELPLMLSENDVDIPIINSLELHMDDIFSQAI